MDKIRVGIAGGSEAPVFLEAAAEAGLEIAGIWIPDPGRGALRLAEEYGLGRPAGTLEELLEDATMDTIAIALPPPKRLSCALAALEAGRNVLLLKPWTINPKEAQRLLEAARDSHGVIFEVDGGQAGEIAHRLKRAAAQIGAIRLVQLNVAQLGRVPDTYSRRDKAVLLSDPGDLQFWERVFGCLDFLIDLLGKPSKITFTGGSGRDLDHTGVALLQYPRCLATLAVSTDSLGVSQFMLQGTTGMIRAQESPLAYTGFTRIQPDGTEKVELSKTIESPLCRELRLYQELLARDDRPVLEERLERSCAVLSVLAEVRKQAGLSDPLE